MLGAWTLALLTVAYLGSLFALAALVDRGVGRRLSRHPAVTTLALGVFATTWTMFASVGFAATEGWRYLSTLIGATVGCALVPVVWGPLARVARARQLASPADLYSYRYQSRIAAGLVTALLLVSSLPYQALQLHAVVETVAQLGDAGARGAIAATTTGLLVLFGVIYGVRHLTPRERHDGLVAAVAFESVVKLLAFSAVGVFALAGVFGGAGGLTDWLEAHPEAAIAITKPARESSWIALLLLEVTAVFLLPQMWHLAFTEGDERGLRAASFGLPAYLMLLSLGVPLILWAGQALGLSERPDFYPLGLVRASGSGLLAGAVFLGALSAATSMIVVTTVALAGMVQKHLILPLTGVAAGQVELYPRLRWERRGLVAGIILLGYAVYLVTPEPPRLVDLGLAAVVAVGQLLPGLAGVLFWPRATARGVIAGLCAGIACWIITPVIPILASGAALPFDMGTDLWTFSTVLSLSANALAFVWGSLRREPTATERDAAEFCRRQIEPPGAGLVSVTSVVGFVARLAPILGAVAAESEVARALADLGLKNHEARPDRLQMLRDRLERNLSGLLGPMTARMIVDEKLDMAGVAHDVRNPLAGIAWLAQNLQAEIADADVADGLRQIVEQTERIDRIVRVLMDIARPSAGGPSSVAERPVSLEKVIADAVTQVRLARAQHAVVLDVDVPANLVVPGERLEQVVVNLLTNACDASPAGEKVRIAAERVGARARIAVTDTGQGMSEEVCARIFEPFFTTKAPGQGTGLGMTVVYSIVVACGGTIVVDSRLGEGTTVTVELPAEPEVQQ